VPANKNPICHPYTSCRNTAASPLDLPGVLCISLPIIRPPTNTSLLKLRKFAQVTLPADLRKKFNLAEGDFLEAEAVEKEILLKPVTVVEREKVWNQLYKSMENVKDRKPKPKQSAKKQEEEIAKMMKNFRKQHV